MSDGAEQEYTRRLAARRARLQLLGVRERRLSHARLVVFVAAAIATWMAFGTRTLAASVPLGLFALFAALAVAHDRVIRERQRVGRAVAHYERGLARLQETWMGGGNPGEHLRPREHDYADDLDLFGEGSLFELLCSARTPMGERSLADWLCAPAAPEVVRARQ